MQFTESMMAVAFMGVAAVIAKLLGEGPKSWKQSPADYWAIVLFVLIVLSSVRLARIETKLDEMNQCGPVEVQVSDE